MALFSLQTRRISPDITMQVLIAVILLGIALAPVIMPVLVRVVFFVFAVAAILWSVENSGLLIFLAAIFLTAYIIAAAIFGTSNSSGSRAEDLHNAAADNAVALIERLIANGANVNAKDENGDTAVHAAAANNAINAAKALLNKEADINATNNEGNTPLHMANANGKHEIAKFLRGRGAK